MHISIPVTEELPDHFGGRFVLYSVYLEGFLLFKVRYKDLHLWDEKFHRVFGNLLPAFPPKYYLAMTKSMVEERRLHLEQYLQNLVSDKSIAGSEIFIECFTKLQLETSKIPKIKMILNVYLADSKQVQVNVQTSDIAERVMEAALYKLGVSRELMKYFSLFLVHKDSNGVYKVLCLLMKKIAGFELPFITIWSLSDEQFQIDIRKWYFDPSVDRMLIGCTATVHLMYIQAVQELEMKWSKPTEDQDQKLQHLAKTKKKLKFLELMQEVQHYGYLQLAPCSSNYPEVETTVTLSVGNSELIFGFKLSNGQNETLCLPIDTLTCWHVKLHASEKGAVVPKQHQQLEFKMEYRQGDVIKWFSIHTEQAFLLSSCLKKILQEQPTKCIKQELEIIEKPTVKKSLKKCVQIGTQGKNKTYLANAESNPAFDGFPDLEL
ncbi:sorting nexin-31 [Bombina bombina]|uniref:sorting nexin-31 n=1 Tax=Bombina bombina TaxID=8345 RepID=UPI00235ACE4E|nr:sorting nexin-31 [Bombina bombina]